MFFENLGDIAFTIPRNRKGEKPMEALGKYTVKETNEVVEYSFDYLVLEGENAQAKIDDAVSKLGAEKVATDIQRTLKVDSNNTAREKAKSANGHSTRVALTEEQKVENKAKRKANAELLQALVAKGLTLDDIENM